MIISLVISLLAQVMASTPVSDAWVSLALEAAHNAVDMPESSDEIKELPGYRFEKRYVDSYTGFQAFHYKCVEVCEFQELYTISGTQSTSGVFDWRDWATNMSFGLFQYDTNAAQEFKLDFFRSSQVATVLLTGHSLGGMLAQAMLYELILTKTTEIPVVSIFFAAPGAYQLIERVHKRDYPDYQFNLIDVLTLPTLNFAFKKDAVPRIGMQVGETWLFPDEYTKAVKNHHWMHYIPWVGSVIKAHLYPAFKAAIADHGLFKLIPYSNKPIVPPSRLRRIGEKWGSWWLRMISRSRD